MKLKATPTSLPEVLLVEHERVGDARGFFAEVMRVDQLAEFGITEPFVQDNHSRSARGVLRGLHYQKEPRAIGKLVRCLRGKIFDAAVDIRKGSPRYGQWVGLELCEDDGRMLWVPPGFAHGFCTVSESADVFYKVTDYYAPEVDCNVRWNDPAIGIEWPIDKPTLSSRDEQAPLLVEADNAFVY